MLLKNAWGVGVQAWLDPGVEMVMSVICLCPSLCSALCCVGFLLRQASLHPSSVATTVERECVLPRDTCRNPGTDAHWL